MRIYAGCSRWSKGTKHQALILRGYLLRDEDKLGKFSKTDHLHRRAEPGAGILNTIDNQRHLIGTLRRETDRVAVITGHAVAQRRTKLVVGGDHGHARVSIKIVREDVGRTKKPYFIDHHLFACFQLIEIVAKNAMNRRRTRGNSRHIVEVDEGRDDRPHQNVCALHTNPRQIGQKSAHDRGV